MSDYEPVTLSDPLWRAHGDHEPPSERTVAVSATATPFLPARTPLTGIRGARERGCARDGRTPAQLIENRLGDSTVRGAQAPAPRSADILSAGSGGLWGHKAEKARFIEVFNQCLSP